MTRRATAWIGCWLALTVASVAQEPAPDENASEPTTQQVAKLQERNELAARAQALQAEGKLAEAIEVAERVLAVEREVFGDEHAEIVGTHGWIAELQEAAEDFPAAEGSRRAAVELTEALYGADDWRATDARLAVGRIELVARLDVAQRGELYRSQELHERARELLSAGRFREAVPFAEEVLRLHQSFGLQDHPDYATCLNTLALLHKSLGDFAASEPLCRQALEINKRALGEKHPGYVLSLNNLAALYSAMGDYARAEPLHLESLEIRRSLYGEDHADYAFGLNNLALLYKAMGDYAKAEPLYRQALLIRKNALGEDHPQYATTLNNLAVLHDTQGDHARAVALLQEALSIRKRALGREHPDYAQSLNNLANAYHKTFDLARAEVLCSEALQVYGRIHGEEHPNYTLALNNLAGIQLSQGDFADAEAHFLQALRINERVLGEDHPTCAVNLNNLAAVYLSMEDYERAEPLLRKSLATKRRVLGTAHPDCANTLNNLAKAVDALGDAAQAKMLLEEALEIERQACGGAHQTYATSLYNLSMLHYWNGDYATSMERLRQAATAYEAARLRMATLGLQRAAYGAHRSPYRLQAAVEAGHGDSVAAWRAMESDLARGLLDEATCRAGRPWTAAEEGERRQLNETLEALEPQILPLAALTMRNAEQGRELTGLLQRRSAVEAQLVQIAAAVSRRQVADFAEVQAALPANAAFVAWVDFAARDPRGQEHWGCVVRSDGEPSWVALPGTGAERGWTEDDANLPERLREALAQAGPSDATGELARRLSAQRIEPLLPHLAGVDRLNVVAVDRMAGVPVEVLTDRFTVCYAPSGTQLVRLKQRERPTGNPTILALGDPIFVRPETSDVDAEPNPPPLPPGGLLVEQVIPQGNAANATIEAGDVLLAYAGTELTSVQQLGELVAAHAADESVVVTVWRESEVQPVERQLSPGKLGVALAREPAPEAIARRRESDQLLARVTRGKSWDELPGTRAEIAGLAKLLPAENITLLADSDASEQRLAALRDSGELVNFRYLHLATHGQVNQASAFESALILAQNDLSTAADVAAGAEFFDGRLTANEILEHWKLNAELVTLSSCESGLGREGGGEGFLGFAQALLLAGSRSVCLSLWEVDDTATALLMDRFYQNLLGRRKGLESPLPKAEALADAKRWLRSLTVSQAAELAADLSHGIARGAGHKTNVVDLVPPTATDADAHPYEHPYFWAAFVLIGDPE